MSMNLRDRQQRFGTLERARCTKHKKRFRPRLENLEQRLVLASFSVNPGDVSNSGIGNLGGLVWAINQANLAGGGNTIDLAAGSTYDLTAVDNNWYGPNGLPPIDSHITIVGNGATIERSSVANTPDFRLFYVSGGEELAAGSLDLENLTLANGLAKGGDGGNGGGGLGAGGAIFNQGTLVVSGVTFANNQSIGGSAQGAAFGGGGGIGAAGDDNGNGGGFGGAFPSGAYGGAGGAGVKNGGGGGGGGFLAGATGAAASDENGGAGGGQGGLGGSALSASIADGGDGGSISAFGVFNHTNAGGGFGFGGTGGGAGGGGGGAGGGGGFGDVSGSSNGDGGSGGFGGGGGTGFGGAGGVGGFGGGGGAGPAAAGLGGFGGGNGSQTHFAGGGGAGLGGAIFTMGAFSNASIAQGAVTIVNSTFAENFATGGAGGATGDGGAGGSGYGGALFNLDGEVTLINATLAHNGTVAGSGDGGPGDSDGGAIYNLAYGNRIDTGDAVAADLDLNNSIIADNSGGDDLASQAINGSNTNSAAITGVSNLVTKGNLGNTALANGVVTVDTDPNLPNLANNGGPTQTIAITVASPAYNAGSSSAAGLLATDQRGAGFPRINFGAVDLGAFEVQTSVSLSAAHSPFAENGTVAITATLDGSSNQDVTVPLTFGGSAVQGVDYSVSASSITIAAGQTNGSITLTGLSNTSFGTSSTTVVVGEGSVTNSTAGSPSTVTATIDPAVSLPAASLTNAVLGNPYSFQITAAGGDGGPYTYSIAGGALPGGLSIDASSGTISGSATQGGNFSFTVQAGDAAHPEFPPATQTYTLEVLPTVSLSDSGSPLAENGGTATITAMLNGASNQDVTVPLTFGGGATQGVDYSVSASSITVVAGQTSGSVTLIGLGNIGFGASPKSVVASIGNVTDSVPGGTPSVTLAIDPALSLTPAILSDASIGSLYHFQPLASGGDGGPYTYAVTGGALPGGLMLDTTSGTISGTPTRGGGFSFTVRASDSTEASFPPASQTYTLEVLPSVSLGDSGSPLAENGGTATVTATLNAASNQDVTVPLEFGGGAAQGVDYSASAASVTIAAGQTSGSITLTGLGNSGFGALPKSVSVSLGSVTNATAGGSSAVTVAIDPAVSLPPASLSNAVLGGLYSFQAAATGGDGGPYTYSITAGALPGGLSLDTDSGKMGGTPTQAGSFSFTLQASDSAQPTFPPASQSYTLEVLPAVSLSESGSPLAVNGGAATVTATLNGVSNQDVTVPLNYSGSAVQNVDYSASATSMTIAAGHTSGSITLTGLDDSGFGTMSKTVVVGVGSLTHAAAGSPSSVTLTIGPAVSLPATTLSDAVLGSADSTSIVATGGDGGPYTYSITAGALPDGLSLDTVSGTISGTPTQGGSFAFTLQASDSTQPSFPPASQAYTLEVLPTVSLSVTGSPFAENGGAATVTATLNGVSNQDVTVPLNFSGSAVQNVDYSAGAASITIAAGHTSGSITLMGSGNSGFGTAPETVIVSLGNLIHAAPGSGTSVTATLAAPSVPSATSFIQSVYLHLLDRPADADALKYWNQVLSTAGNTATGRMQVVADIEASPEYLFDEVNGLYRTYLGRSAAGDGGAQFWVGQLMAGSTLEEVAALIAGSPEFVETQTDGSIGGWLNAFYTDALNRPVDAGAVQQFSALFALGASRAQIAEEIFTAPPQPGQSANEYRLALVDAYYAQFLNRSAEADASSRGWAALLQQGFADQAVIAEIMASQEFFDDSV